MAHGFVLGDILSCASGLMVPFPVVACGAGVPIWNVVSARKAVVPVVEELVRVRRRARTRSGWWRRWNAVWGSSWDWRRRILGRRGAVVGVVVVATSSAG